MAFEAKLEVNEGSGAQFELSGVSCIDALRFKNQTSPAMPGADNIPNEENGGPTSVRGPIRALKIIATKLGKSRVLGVNLGVNIFLSFHFHWSPRSHGIEARERGQRIGQWTYRARFEVLLIMEMRLGKRTRQIGGL